MAGETFRDRWEVALRSVLAAAVDGPGDVDRGVALARFLVNAPPNLLTPARFASIASEAAAARGWSCQTYDRAAIVDGGFGALAAIGSGSANEPRLVVVDTASEQTGPPRVALVGKGITFDSGGLSLKSPDAMQGMRTDMAGAAALFAGLLTTRLDLLGRVQLVLPLAENLPGPEACRPGDIVTAWNGTAIQILDTDFEGRVVLADALALAASSEPELLVDFATLTYQAEIALGPKIAAVIGRSDAAVELLLTAAGRAGEAMWQLPWAPQYLDQVRTSFGVRNHPLASSGRALTAALFLGEFVPETVPWVHVDMAGPVWDGDPSGENATGFGVRTVVELLRTLR